MTATGRLFINGREVGGVTLKSLADSWGFGEFAPNPAFAEFAAIFGKWSLLMHADDGERTLSPEASAELRDAELAIDSLRAKMLLAQGGEWIDLSQLNIDGPLIEWKMSRRRAEPPKGMRG